MSVLQISMSHVSDPPKIDYSVAKNENDYYQAHAGFSPNIAGKVKTALGFVTRLTMLANEQTSKPILKTNQSAM